MDAYLLLKWLHIVSATILFGTGIGTAFLLFMANRRGEIGGIAFATRHVVLADRLFTAPAALVQRAQEAEQQNNLRLANTLYMEAVAADPGNQAASAGVTPLASRKRMLSAQRTGAVICSIMRSAMRAATCGRAVTFEMTGILGAAKVVVSTIRRNASRAGAISGEWKACTIGIGSVKMRCLRACASSLATLSRPPATVTFSAALLAAT